MNLLAEVWSILPARQRRRAIWAQAWSLLMAFSTVIGIASIAPFFAVLGDPGLIHRNGSLRWLYENCGFSDNRSFEMGLGAAFLALVLLANAINVAGSLAIARLAWRIGTHLQSALFAEYLARPYIFHTKTHSAILFNNIIHEASRTTNDIVLNIFVLVTNVATAAFIIVSVLILNPALAAGMLAALAGGYVLIYLAVRNRLLRAGQVQSRFFIEQTKIVDEALGGIKEVIVLRIQEFFRSSFERSSEAYARAAARTVLIRQSPKHVMECVAVAGLVIVAFLGSNDAGAIGPRLGQLTFMGFAAYRLLPILHQVFGAIVQIRAARSGFDAIAADLRPARTIIPAAGAAVLPWTEERPVREIRLKEVSFCYDQDRSLAVEAVSLRIPAKAAVGFVGANGSGKTTLVDLLAGLLSPTGGRLEVDGISIDESNRGYWQSRIAYVPQHIFLLDASIAQNIALGVADDAIDTERLHMAINLAQLDVLVASFTDGYHYRIGERGIRLSGGQRQRIGIARALYTSASVLILDEATNALDGLTQQELVSTILQLRGRYTIILIAHQLSTLQACDIIFEFDKGRIINSGSHAELIASSELFQSALAR
jgi:ATP-binding cassette, subfamily B, bacterial PglK